MIDKNLETDLKRKKNLKIVVINIKYINEII